MASFANKRIMQFHYAGYRYTECRGGTLEKTYFTLACTTKLFTAVIYEFSL